MSEMKTPPIPFRAWPKIYRLNRDIIITEKLDGTNAGVLIVDETTAITHREEDGVYVRPGVYASSRKRWITPESDNYGFARWVDENKETLIRDLGTGMHFGEWWGQGIQRKYDAPAKFWSLFNTTLWYGKDFETPNLKVVPVLYQGGWFEDDGTYAPENAVGKLCENGSAAAPGFANPEGIVVFHTATNTPFKFTLDGDGHKG
jgi:hypothetical protein